jgi:hypothetical protein
MINETRVSVAFKQPVELPDIHDGQKFLSTKHWIIAAYCQQLDGKTLFLSAAGEIVAAIPTDIIESIKFQRLSSKSSIITTKNNRDYIQKVKAVKKAQWSRWSKEEDIELMMRVDMGYSIQTLSTLHNRSEWAIWSRLVYWGIEKGYEAPERGVRVPEHMELQSDDLDKETGLICLNCGLSIAEPTCKCWNKSIYARNYKLERFKNDI